MNAIAIRGNLPRRPLVVCLAAAFACGIASATQASDHPASALRDLAGPVGTRPAITQPSDLPIGSRKRAAWERWRASAPPSRPATTLVVSNCADSGAGSLRDAIGQAVDGDTIDLTQLTCSTITLTSGAISVGPNNLALDGPGRDSLTIDAGHYSQGLHQSAFYHFGNGTFEINNLRVGNASYTGYYNPAGGCIFSEGLVRLSAATVAYCSVSPPPGTTGFSSGGAIYAVGGVYLDHSSVSDGTSDSPSSTAFGGGIYSKNGFQCRYSIVSNNYVVAADYYAFGGGVVVTTGSVGVAGCAIVDNYSNHNNGGIEILSGGKYAEFLDSTVSNNFTLSAGGAIFSDVPLSLYNSTVAFNSEGNNGNGAFPFTMAAGVDVYNNSLVTISSIVADNFNYGSPFPYSDISGYNVSVTGASNLTLLSYIQMPADTLYNDPQLKPLAFNGGPTPTNALYATSPAIDHGNNEAMVRYDQRGVGFPRVVGSSADIGAYELNTNDTIFANGFD